MAQYATALRSDTARLDALTPRTPFSRAGRAEYGAARLNVSTQDVEDSYELDYASEDHLNSSSSADSHQRAPLLTSSADDAFPHRRAHPINTQNEKSGIRIRGIRISWSHLWQRGPLLAGIATAILLLFMVLMSVDTPDQLHTFLHGASSPFAHLGTGFDSSSHKEVESNVTHPIISYDNYTSFPLSTKDYREECGLFMSKMKGMHSFWWTPPSGSSDVLHENSPGTCSSSITYVLDGKAGLAADLALIAQAAGLAREQNRAFFIDDSRWNRGKWTDLFEDVRALQPGPEPGCLPPPPEELVACPRTARHWVITSQTALFHFGHGFHEEFDDAHARELRRLKPIFTRAALSFNNTIRPSAHSAHLIRTVRQELAAIGSAPYPYPSSSYIALHVRRGDRKPESWRYHGQYVPLNEFMQAMRETRERVEELAHQKTLAMYIASDSPIAIQDLSRMLREEEGLDISLFFLEKSAHEEVRALASGWEYVQREFATLKEEERMRLTRGALVDFALVTGMWAWDVEGYEEAKLEATVCTISSNFCKLAAVGLGWERAFGFDAGDANRAQMAMDDERKRWVEIDNRGIIEPTWRALEMF